MMKMLLKKLDIVADTAENGRIAVEMILGAAEPYHLVFMDNLMPEMVPSYNFEGRRSLSMRSNCMYPPMYVCLQLEWSGSD